MVALASERRDVNVGDVIAGRFAMAVHVEHAIGAAHVEVHIRREAAPEPLHRRE